MNFDNEERLNEDGSVTIRIIPSRWHVLNMSPDTYQMWNSDHYDDSVLLWYEEEVGEPVGWDDLTWEHDQAGIVRGLSQRICDYIEEQLMFLGLESVSNVRVVDSWSPRAYNFCSDGFEMEFTCDPAELRSLTEEFDVDEWVSKHYGSRDGFLSFVTSRVQDPEFRAVYDGEFRIESLLVEGLTDSHEREWELFVSEGYDEVYAENTEVSPSPATLTQIGDIRMNECGEFVRYTPGKGWASDDAPEEFYDTPLHYHREASKLVPMEL